MSNGLMLRDREVIFAKAMAPVIFMRPVAGESYKHKEEAPRKKAEKKMPLFYTAPIFRSKKHDFF